MVFVVRSNERVDRNLSRALDRSPCGLAIDPVAQRNTDWDRTLRDRSRKCGGARSAAACQPKQDVI